MSSNNSMLKALLSGLMATSLWSGAMAGHFVPRQGSNTTTFVSDGNPILSDGTIYSADPAPFVVDGTVFILAGRDEADATTNTFIMNEWQVFEAEDPQPAGGEWTLHSNIAQPQQMFAWADPGGAYASQIIRGPDGRFYFYASVTQSDPDTPDAFSVGVAVSDSPTGPFVDAHPDGPIISQSVPEPNDLHNIDPVVLIDDDLDGRVFVYWGSFNQLRGLELSPEDMVTPIGDVVTVDSLTGFFEAPWFMKRNGTYYMIYAANNAGPDSPCTPTSYHACLAYGTASEPLGPWTFQGVILHVVSSTTSHPGVYELDGEHYLVYHTADADDGGHFRRSIAFDLLEFDEGTSPPSILVMEQTFREELTVPRPPSRNIAPLASGAESENGTPVQYWIAALNDERVPVEPLPPDYWSSWAGEDSPEQNVLTYTWDEEVEVNGVAVAFHADSPDGSDSGVAPPAEWWVEYLDAQGEWQEVEVTSDGGFVTEVTDDPDEVTFETVQATALRATLVASGASGQFAAVGIKEWFVFAPEPVL